MKPPTPHIASVTFTDTLAEIARISSAVALFEDELYNKYSAAELLAARDHKERDFMRFGLPVSEWSYAITCAHSYRTLELRDYELASVALENVEALADLKAEPVTYGLHLKTHYDNDFECEQFGEYPSIDAAIKALPEARQLALQAEHTAGEWLIECNRVISHTFPF